MLDRLQAPFEEIPLLGEMSAKPTKGCPFSEKKLAAQPTEGCLLVHTDTNRNPQERPGTVKTVPYELTNLLRNPSSLSTLYSPLCGVAAQRRSRRKIIRKIIF